MDGFVLSVGPGASAKQCGFHLAQRGMGIDPFFGTHTVTPFVSADATNPAIGCTAGSVVTKVVSQDVVTRVVKMDVGFDEVDFEVGDLIPWSARWPGKP